MFTHRRFAPAIPTPDTYLVSTLAPRRFASREGKARTGTVPSLRAHLVARCWGAVELPRAAGEIGRGRVDIVDALWWSGGRRGEGVTCYKPAVEKAKRWEERGGENAVES